MNREIKFENRIVVSVRSGEELYHDDMCGEDVWISLRYKPEFIDSYDFREFNGIPIKEMTKILEKYDEKIVRADLDVMADLRDLRYKYPR